jgi:hypothetical protein
VDSEETDVIFENSAEPIPQSNGEEHENSTETT